MVLILDSLRVALGLALLSALVSLVFTGSSTFNYHGRWTDFQYYRFLFQYRGHRQLTLSQLVLYNGSDSSLPIYIAINGTVYDVSASKSLYSPPLGRYSVLSGHECARMLITGCMGKKDELTSDLRGLKSSPEEIKTILNRWNSYYDKKSKYWVVGNIVDENHYNEDSEIPTPCLHPVRVPHGII